MQIQAWNAFPTELQVALMRVCPTIVLARRRVWQ